MTPGGGPTASPRLALSPSEFVLVCWLFRLEPLGSTDGKLSQPAILMYQDSSLTRLVIGPKG